MISSREPATSFWPISLSHGQKICLGYIARKNVILIENSKLRNKNLTRFLIPTTRCRFSFFSPFFFKFDLLFSINFFLVTKHQSLSSTSSISLEFNPPKKSTRDPHAFTNIPQFVFLSHAQPRHMSEQLFHGLVFTRFYLFTKIICHKRIMHDTFQ